MEKAILVGVRIDTNSNKNISEFQSEMEELKSLAIACNIETVEVMTQNLEAINRQSYIGKGKIDELKMICESLEVDIVVCNDELSPLQISTLQEALDITVYDRTYLILEIFKSRARTKEALIQVEIASLNYMLPRLAGLRKGLSRQRGTGGGFAHGRGAGESKLELDRRITNDKIAALRKELKELTTIRKQQRVKRNKSDIRTVCLVGYTNSGKSTLMNAILKRNQNIQEDKKVLQKDMLFATLETSSRRIDSKLGSFILTDTVGFIEKLPHHLVEAFKSTLEEISEADLIIHVIDASNPRYLKQIEATENVLREIGVKNIPMIHVFNKIDALRELITINDVYDASIGISAKEDFNIDELIEKIVNTIYWDYQNVTFLIPYGEESIMYKIKQKSVKSVIIYHENVIMLSCKTNNQTIKMFEKYLINE